MVMVRQRLAAASSVAAVFAALAVATSPGTAAATTTPVAFTSQPTSAEIVAHYVVSPFSAGPGHASASTDESPLAPKWPKGNGPASVINNSSGVSGSSGSGTATTATPSPSASFIGQQGSAKTCPYFGQGCNPPDMALAASPQFVFQGVNMQFEVWDTAGNPLVTPVNAQGFFGVPSVTNADGTPCDTAHKSQPFMSDPRALYDAADGRFWAAMLQVEGAQAFGVALDCPYKSVYFVAVSQTNDPRGKWNVFEFNMEIDINGQKFAADYTQLGINSQAVYFSGNMFGESGGFFAELFEANKAQMEKGQAHFTADGFFNLRGTGPGAPASRPFLADTVQPADNLDNSAGTSETFIGTMDGPDVVTGNSCGFRNGGGGFNDSCSGVVVWTMANPIGHDSGGPAPTFGGTLVPSLPFLVNVPFDQPSCNLCVDANDLRIPATPVIRNGVLYAAWGTAINNGNNSSHPTPGIEWEQVKLSDLSTVSNYYNFSGDDSVTYPVLMPDSTGGVTMLFERSSSTVFPETRFIVKGAGDANFAGTGQLLKAGESSYRPTLCGKAIPVCRWGDYEAASFDGSGHIWFAGEYANLFQGVSTPPAFGRNWGTWIGAIPAT
jgi:hypothetical protein